jgi:hypothetical protein
LAGELTPTASAPAAPAPPSKTPAAILPWLGALTLAVLYLLVRTFF